jgi:hypothetical protein
MGWNLLQILADFVTKIEGVYEKRDLILEGIK